MSEATSKVDLVREQLRDAHAKGTGATAWTYMKLSGPGWLQSAITLGGGSLASSLFLGVLAGVSLLWLQPLAMVMGVIMLSAIAYVTCSTGENPLRSINTHVSPVLGWGWLLAALAANMFWCMPQYALATGVIEQNLASGLLGAGGAVQSWAAGSFGEGTWLAANASKLVIVGVILFVTTLITWAYDSGGWGIRLYEWVLKAMVAGIVLCFFGVVFAIRNEVNWGGLFMGFVPDFRLLYEPTARMQEAIAGSAHVDFWSGRIVAMQRDVMISAAATAVGINMTFLFPYSILDKRWTREFRGLAIFDLSTGMFIPFVLATSCVVIAAADAFNAQPVLGFFGETDDNGVAIQPDGPSRAAYQAELKQLLIAQTSADSVARLSDDELAARIGELPESDRRIAAMLVKRSPFDLARSLSKLAGPEVANWVFGLGVLGMALSTITLLMLISGYCVCEMFGLPIGGWPKRLGALAAATGVLGPFIWGQASFWLAVYVSAFGMMLIPIAYWSFFFLMNQPRLLGANMPRGRARWTWNTLMIVAASIATAASVYTVYDKLRLPGLGVYAAFIGLAFIVQALRKPHTPERDAAR